VPRTAAGGAAGAPRATAVAAVAAALAMMSASAVAAAATTADAGVTGAGVTDGGVTEGGAVARDGGPTADPAVRSGAPADGAAGAPGPPAKAPVPLGELKPAYPEAAMNAGVEGNVALILTIDAAGAVTDVEVESGLAGGLTEAAVAVARAARFRPAEDAAGRPTPVRLRWLVSFTLPEKRTPLLPGAGGAAGTPRPPAAPAPPGAGGAGGAGGGAGAMSAAPLPPGVERFLIGPDAALAIRVRERGTGKDLPLATVFIEDVGELLHLDAGARAQRTLPPGAYVLVIRAPGHTQEERIERLRAGEKVDRTYFIEKERLAEYETVVRARPPRPETGVVTLQGQEIHGIPGTFGDPFRTAMLLPGVGSIVSGVGYPVIRGESPGQTGTFIDEVRVPLLYHLGFGPAVVHPLYLDSLDFHPGNFPAEFGRFTGALIQAHTVPPPSERQTMVSADLFKLSAFHSHPFRLAEREAAVTASARYGTFAFLAQALDPNAVLEYWDYQLRADLKLGRGDVRLLLFGAQDQIGNRAHVDERGQSVDEEVVKLGFHRLALRYRGLLGAATRIEAGFEVGPDYTTASGEQELKLKELVMRPHAAMTVPLGKSFKLRFGADLLVQSWDTRVAGSAQILRWGGFPLSGLTPGAFLQGDWQPGKRWLLRAGVRFDFYSYKLDSGRNTQHGFDPRLAARYEIRPGLFVKASAGIYQSPPRFLLPWPGLEGFGLNRGLNRSYQVSAGVEVPLPWDATIDAQVYGAHLTRVTEFVLDEDLGGSGDDLRQSTFPGRSYGFEVIARRRLGHRLFGWLTYSLARAERQYLQAGWRPADFDQTHITNAVVSYALGRSWTVSAVFHYHTGRPYTPGTPAGALRNDGLLEGGNPFTHLPENRNIGRLPGFWRADLRIEKREAFDTWYLDFYVDWLNISLRREAVAWNDDLMEPETALVTIPTIGLQATF
jgi:TonB family protein